MIKPKVFVTRQIPKEALELLESRCDVDVFPGKCTKENLLSVASAYDAIIPVSGIKIDTDVCNELAARCKIIAGHGVGYNNIDVEAATRLGIWVTNTPDVVTDATADLAFSLLCAVSRRICEGDKFVRAGHTEWGPTNLLGTQISGKTLGIIGAGRIGYGVARRAIGFNMSILYVDNNINKAFDELGAKRVTKEELLTMSDFITLHVPLTADTKHYISKNEFNQMKRNAILINCSRGAVVNEAELIYALKNGIIKAAGLDVFEYEPIVSPELLELENVVLTPHIGTSTLETRIRMGEMCTNNILAVLDGHCPPQAINQIKQ